MLWLQEGLSPDVGHQETFDTKPERARSGNFRDHEPEPVLVVASQLFFDHSMLYLPLV
jgi:hypothetical protein